MRILLLFLPLALSAADWRPLFNGQNLDGWTSEGEGRWTVLADKTLLGQRSDPGENPMGPWPATQDAYKKWRGAQAWLYTIADFDEFDLHVEYFLPPGGNSGVSIRDPSRGRKSFGPGERSSPAHIGYEIQIIDSDQEIYPTASIYLFAKAKIGLQKPRQWNTMEIESRHNRISVKLNGTLAAEHPGDLGRALHGPIGLQLHDRYTWMMFRNIQIREITH